jgi:hypothetical protein
MKRQPNVKREPAPEMLAKRKAKASKRAHRRGTIAQIAWDAGAQPAYTIKE